MCKPQSFHSGYSENCSCHPHCFLLYKINLAISYLSRIFPLYFTTSWEARSDPVLLYACELMSGPWYTFQHMRSVAITSKTALNCHVPGALYLLQYGLCSAPKSWMYRKFLLQTKQDQGLRSRLVLGLCRTRCTWGSSLLRLQGKCSALTFLGLASSLLLLMSTRVFLQNALMLHRADKGKGSIPTSCQKFRALVAKRHFIDKFNWRWTGPLQTFTSSGHKVVKT